MRIQYMSDLHMELYDNSRYIKAKEFEATGDVLVLAGDTFYLRDIIAPQKRFWNWASKNFRQVLMVPGNHEFYGNGDVIERGDSWQWMFRENVGYYYNKVVRIDDIDFILTTLWSKIPEVDMFYVLRGMNDFRQIMYDGRRFMPEDFNLEHEKCIRFLKQAVNVLLGQELLYTVWEDGSRGTRSYRSCIIGSVGLRWVVLALASDRRSSGQGLLNAQAGPSLLLTLLKRPVGAA